jgi:hypothetical protein
MQKGMLYLASLFCICIFAPMKSKEQILDSYYTPGKDGLPEMSAADLLKAMDEYAEQSFAAARELSQSEFTYPSFADYQSSLQITPADIQSDNIRLIADSVVTQFLPTDPQATTFSFEFRSEGNNHTAHYIKNSLGYWEFEKGE